MCLNSYRDLEKLKGTQGTCCAGLETFQIQAIVETVPRLLSRAAAEEQTEHACAGRGGGEDGGGVLPAPLREVPEAQGAASYLPTSAPSALAGLVLGFICVLLSGLGFLLFCFVETDFY